MAAKVNVGKHPFVLDAFQTGGLRNEIHHPVVAAHKFAQTTLAIAEMLFPVSVSEYGSAADHGCAENVDPSGQGHVDRGRRVDGL